MKKRIKICYTIPNFDTAGSGIALMKLIDGLDKSIFEPSIVCLHDRGSYFENVVRKSGVKIHIYPYVTPLRPLVSLIKNCWRTSRFFKKEKFDIVFSYHYGADYSEAIAAKMAGCKFLYVKKNMSWKGASYNGWRIKTWLADAITVQNTDMLKSFYKEVSKAELLSIGVDTNEYMPKTMDLDLLKELGWTEDNGIVLCVANIIPKKGIDYLLKGFAQLLHYKPGTKLLIVGDCNHPLGKEMMEMSLQLGLEKSVIFTGKRHDIARFYSIADIFILPSTGNEGAPIVIQEAMASGALVVTTDTPGNRDQLSNLPDQLISPSNAEAIKEALIKYLTISKEEKARRVQKQHDIVNAQYSLKAEVEKHQFLYKRIMKY